MDAASDPSLDLALVQRVLAGNAAANRVLADRLVCVPRILTAENSRLGRPFGPHDLADVVGDTLLAVMRKLPEYRGLGVLEAWAFHICRFELLNALRRRRRQPAPLEEDAEIVSDAAAREWRRLVARDALETAIDRIGGVEAETLRLRHFEGLSFEAIAARTGESDASVRARHHRAMNCLEQALTAQQRKEEAIHDRST